MDTLAIIREKADRLATLSPSTGIIAVVRHIEMAERHFAIGRADGDPDLFADVIFRTNHAYEGILRESYALLAAQDPKGKSTYNIEQYLGEQAVFKDRVLELFKNYREKWRNPSTHDHVLTFSESEAFLALLSVTSFVALLMDQVTERIAFQREELRLTSERAALRQEMGKHTNEPLIDRADFLLGTYAASASAASEAEFVGGLLAFLHTVAPNISVRHEVEIQDQGTTITLDLILQDGDEKVVVEAKHAIRWTTDKEKLATDQVRRYIRAADAKGGVLLVWSSAVDAFPEQSFARVHRVTLDDGRFVVVIRARPSAASTSTPDPKKPTSPPRRAKQRD